MGRGAGATWRCGLISGRLRAFCICARLERIRYEIIVDTDESDQRLALLHENVKKYGTVFNTIAPGTDLAGTLRRK